MEAWTSICTLVTVLKEIISRGWVLLRQSTVIDLRKSKLLSIFCRPFTPGDHTGMTRHQFWFKKHPSGHQVQDASWPTTEDSGVPCSHIHEDMVQAVYQTEQRGLSAIERRVSIFKHVYMQAIDTSDRTDGKIKVLATAAYHILSWFGKRFVWKIVLTFVTTKCKPVLTSYKTVKFQGDCETENVLACEIERKKNGFHMNKKQQFLTHYHRTARATSRGTGCQRVEVSLVR